METTELASVRLAARYAYVRELGRGSAGRVVQVRDASDGRLYAVKMVGPEHADRLRWELSVLSGVAHPGLARVHELFELEAALPAPFSLPQGGLALVEEFAAGAPAHEVRVPAERRVRFVVGVGLAVSRALSALHALGLAHGDVKPSNIRVPDDPLAARLIDLGLARPFGRAAHVSGTPAFLAPEAWLGEVGVASDLYALGATLHALLSDGAGGSDSWLRAPVAPRIPRLDELPATVPTQLRRLLGDLLASSPTERPRHAREVAHRLASLGPQLGLELDPTASIHEGDSAAERAARMTVLPRVGASEPFDTLVAHLASGLESGAVVVVAGPSGSGRTRLVRDAVRHVQRTARPVPTYLVHDGPVPPPLDHAAVVHLEGAGVDLAACRAATEAAAVEGRPLTVVVERSDIESADVRLGPVSDHALVALLRTGLELDPTPGWVKAAREMSGGLPGRLCRGFARLLRSGATLRPGALLEHGVGGGDELDLAGGTRSIARRLALAGGRLPRGCLGAAEGVAPAVRALLADGLAHEDEAGWVALRPDVLASLPPEDEDTRSWAAEVFDLIPVGRPRALLTWALHGDAEPLEREIAGLLAAGEPERAALLGRLSLRRQACTVPILRGTGEALRALARESEALDLLRDVDGVRALRAELLRLTGDGDAAAREAPRDTAMGCAIQARLALGAGRLDDALEWCSGRYVGSDCAEAAVRRQEVRAFVALARGDLNEAGEAARAALEREADGAAAARAHATWAAVLHAEGQIERAASETERALRLAEAAGERLAAATYRVNAGIGELERGRPGPAIEALREGAAELVRLQRTRAAARALYNLANAASLVGDDDLASDASARAEQSVPDDPELSALVGVVQAELLLRAGKVELAGQRLARAAHPALPPAVQATLEARRAIVLAIQRRLGASARALEMIDATSLVGAARIEVRVAQVRLAIEQERLDDAASTLAGALDGAEAGFESRLRVALIAAELGERRGVPDRRALARARALLDAAAASLPPHARLKLRAVPAYSRAFAQTPRTVERAAGGSSEGLARFAKQLVRESSVSRLREAIVDAGVDLSGAERGFLVSRQEDGTLRVHAARAFGAALSGTARPSMSVVERVLMGGAPVVSVDALEDKRLSAAESIHAMALRSILALPVPTEPPMVLVLDDRLRPAAFADATVQTVGDLAEIAAGALERVQALERERGERHRLARAEQRLAARFEAAERALAAQGAASPFDRIVAESEAMRATLDYVGRVALSDAAILVRGESGVGKELVARAVHDASARRDGPFIGENVSAIAEPLLESTLFGHVRGAFTGAERDRRGLFELAEGGTLFLDEVGEMPVSMQAKLLRVLQDGELRPVGSEEVRRVDVRLVSATHRDLEAMVASGAFRQDLYYRIAVVTVPIRPLRERPEDIPALLHEMVARHATHAVRFTPRALEALHAHDWPGNVRELENEVRRALLLADDEVDVPHLSLSPAEVEEGLAPMDLKGQVAALERRLIRRALEETGGNQTQAAKRLGVSRYGLSKMLKRLGL